VLTGESVFAELEAYLSLGTVSVREAWQAAQSARHQYLAAKLETRAVNVERFLNALQAFACQNEPKLVRTRKVPEGGQLTLDLRSSDVA
jgi:pantothenate synthetase